MGLQRLVPSAPVLPCTKVRPDQSHSIGCPCGALISAKGGHIWPEVRRLLGPGQSHVGLETTLARRRADWSAGCIGRTGECPERHDVAIASNPEGSPAELPTPAERERQRRVSRRCARQSRLEVRHSRVVDLAVERQGEVPHVHRRPSQGVVAMAGDGCVEVFCDIRRYQERSEQPHFRSLLDCVADCPLCGSHLSAGKLQPVLTGWEMSSSHRHLPCLP